MWSKPGKMTYDFQGDDIYYLFNSSAVGLVHPLTKIATPEHFNIFS